MKILQTLCYMWRANAPELLICEEASTPRDSKSRLLPSLFEPAEPSHEEHGALCCPRPAEETSGVCDLNIQIWKLSTVGSLL